MEFAEARKKMLDEGYSREEIAQLENGFRSQLASEGYGDREINDALGIDEPDMRDVQAQIAANLAKAKPAQPAQGSTPEQEGPQREADGILEAFQAGTQMSVTGLAARKRMPNLVVPEHAGLFRKLASAAGTFAGDIPAMWAGGAAGGALGAAYGGEAAFVAGTLATLNPAAGVAAGTFGTAFGGTIGGTAGAFAFPAFLRKAMIDQYEKGAIDNWEDFYARTFAAFKEAAKHGAIGAITGGAGTYAKLAVGASRPLIHATTLGATATTAEIAAMTFAGKMIENQMPNASDFVENAVFVGGMHAIRHAPQFRQGLNKIFVKAGVWGEQVNEAARENPALFEDLAATNGEPEKYFDAAPEPGSEKAPEKSPEQARTRADVKKEYDQVVDERDHETDPKKQLELELKMEQLAKEGQALDAAAEAAKPRTKTDPATGQILEEFDADGNSTFKDSSDLVNKKTGEIVYERGDVPFEVLRADGESPAAPRPPVLVDRGVFDKARADHLWEQVKAGKTDAYGHKSAALVAAKKARKAGALTTRAEVDAFLADAEAIEATHAGTDLKKMMKHLVERTVSGPGVEVPEPEVKEAPKGYEPHSLEQAVSNTLDHIHQDGQPERDVTYRGAKPAKTEAPLKWYQVWRSNWWDNAYKSAVDEGHYIKALVDAFSDHKELPGAEDPYVRYRNSAGAGRQADHALHYGTFNINTLRDTGASLIEALGPWRMRLNEVRAYISSLHALELQERVSRARRSHGDLNTGPQIGDRVAILEPEIDAIGEIIGIKDGQARVGYTDAEGKSKRYSVPLEEVKRRLIATVAGKEVRNIETGFDLKDAKLVVESASPELRQVGKAIVEFNERVTDDFLVESGLVSKETATEWKKLNPANVPFFRLMDTVSEGSSLFARHGSLKTVIDPIESIIRNVHAFTKRANLNVATRKLVDLVLSDAKGKEIFKLVKDPLVETTVPVQEMATYLKRLGAKVEPEELSFLRKDKIVLDDNQLQVWREGKREVYQVAEKYQPVVDALRSLSSDDLPVAMHWMRSAAGTLRTGATMTLEFLTTNALRDQPATYLNSKNGYIPFLSAIDGLASIWSEDNAFRTYLKSGAGMSTIAELDRDYIEKNIFDLSAKTGMLSSMRNGLRSAKDTLSAVLEANEMMTRVGEFKAAMENGKDPFRAGFEARDLLDFSRSGAKTKALSGIVAFFNAQVQGGDKLARAMGIGKAISGIREQRLDLLLDAGKDVTKLALKATPLMLATVYLWWANKEDPRYKNAPKWQRDIAWIVPTDNWENSDEQNALRFPEYLRRQANGRWQVNTGTTMRIAKPFEAGVLLFSLTERLLDQFYAKNPRAFDGFSETLNGVTFPSFMPTAAVPLLEQYSNRRWMSGTKLIPSYLEELSPDLQYTEYTTETAKKFAGIVPKIPVLGRLETLQSPMLVENWVRGITGPLGMQAMQLVDYIASRNGYYNVPPKPEATWADTPFFRAFTVRYPSASAQPVSDFHERYSKLTRVNKDVAHLKNTLQLDEMQKRIESAGNSYGLSLKEIQAALGSFQQQAHVIAFDREMKPAEKRQALDGVYYAIIEIAEMGNQILDDLEGKPARVMDKNETKAFNAQQEAQQ